MNDNTRTPLSITDTKNFDEDQANKIVDDIRVRNGLPPLYGEDSDN